MREAPARELLHALWRDGATVAAYDPKATEEARRLYPAELADRMAGLCCATPRKLPPRVPTPW